jgi:hypothetical protein
MALGVGVEEMRKEDRTVEKANDWLESLFRKPVMKKSGKDTLDAIGLEGAGDVLWMGDDWIREWQKGR